MAGPRKRRAVIGAGASILAIGSALAGATGAAAARPAATHSTSGGTAYFAELANGTPNYIFPFMNLAFFSVTNIAQFQYLMFRPLYWFGQGTAPSLNLSLSVGNNPVYSNGNTKVTFSLKNYRWSNGEKVTPQDVVFWMNLMKVEKLNWAGYAPGTLPDDLKSVTTSGDSVTFTLSGPVNSYWFTYNELGQVTPLPMAWDISANGQKGGSAACGTASYQSVTVTQTKTKGGTTVTPVSPAAKSCAAVYSYMSKESGYDPSNPKAPNNSLGTYATNPLWQVVDGPWHLTAFNPDGQATFKPNPSYSGPVKAKLSSFVELPYTSAASEFNALVGGKLTVGYLPPEDVTAQAKSPTVPGPNNPRLTNFTIAPWYPWGINYFPENFNTSANGGVTAKVFHQLYFRQALQMLVDQPLYIKKLFHGYAVPTYGPVPILPPNPFASSLEKQNPYPYDPAKAVKLLASHGWNVTPNGVTTCSDASKCGVPKGAKLDFNLQYSAPTATQTTEMQAEQASFAQAGIKVNLSVASFDTVIGTAVPCSGASCTWQMENWAGGWTYSPDYYPTGEVLFQTGAGSNSGSYSDPTNDTLIKGTNFGKTSIQSWENYIVTQAPVIWQPEEAYQLTEVQKNLHGVTPQNPLMSLTPESWYFSK
ncbi:MAG: ABC transporter substrate-binding protein [Actinomycetota bacterium]|nr:ABC transporter substrate-binding protein [Actinomycetota bacterium]